MASPNKQNIKIKVSGTLYGDIIKAAIAAALILLLPLLAMQFTNDVIWTPFDFAAAFTLLFGAGFSYKLLTRKSPGFIYKAASGAAVGTALFLIWSNLAVGLIGSENNPANLMYFGVLAVAFIGTLIVRFQPLGMSFIMFATAFAQVLVAVIALFLGMHRSPGSSVAEILGVTGFFVMLWVGSALLYRYAALQQPPVNAEPER